MRRLLALLIIAVAVAPGTWWRMPPPVKQPFFRMTVRTVQVPPGEELARHLGPFRLEKIWGLESENWQFHGYSALVAPEPGRLLALSDRGYYFLFSIPDPSLGEAEAGAIFPDSANSKLLRDVEAGAFDPDTGTIWLAMENTNAIMRFTYADARFDATGVASPPELAAWRGNAGPESLLRLSDGRFLTLREGFDGPFERRRHEGLSFATDPADNSKSERFVVSGPTGFSPTDAAQLPDGRVLVLMRRVVWPVPPRFAGRIAIADPDTISPGKNWKLHEVAKLSSSLPVDNFEGMTILPREDGRVDVWLISDDNNSLLQRTLLWRLSVDPADLPGASKKGAQETRTPSHRIGLTARSAAVPVRPRPASS